METRVHTPKKKTLELNSDETLQKQKAKLVSYATIFEEHNFSLNPPNTEISAGIFFIKIGFFSFNTKYITLFESDQEEVLNIKSNIPLILCLSL